MYDSPEDIERGRQLVEQLDGMAESMADNLRMAAYFDQQREVVRQQGCCGKEGEWLRPGDKQMVCKHTREPCPLKHLTGLTNDPQYEKET